MCYEGYTGSLCEMTTTLSGTVTQGNSTDITLGNSGVSTEPRPSLTTIPSGSPTLTTDIRMQGEAKCHTCEALVVQDTLLCTIVYFVQQELQLHSYLYHRWCSTQCYLSWKSGRSCSWHITRSDSSWNGCNCCSCGALEKGPLGSTTVKNNTMWENIR